MWYHTQTLEEQEWKKTDIKIWWGYDTTITSLYYWGAMSNKSKHTIKILPRNNSLKYSPKRNKYRCLQMTYVWRFISVLHIIF